MTRLVRDPFRILCLGLFLGAFVAVLGGGTCVYTSDDDDAHCYDDDEDNDIGCDNESSKASSTDPWTPSDADVHRSLADLLASPPSGGWAPGGALLFPELEGRSTRLVEGKIVIERSTVPGRHPVARVREIRDISIFDPARGGVHGPWEFAAFSERVLEDNAELIGLPEGAGRLQLRNVHFLDQIIAVIHEQVPPGADTPLDDARMVFVFDLLGRLIQIENDTRV